MSHNRVIKKSSGRINSKLFQIGQQQSFLCKNKLQPLSISFVMILLSFVASPALAEGLGRLFTTPAQRYMLEKLRNPAPAPAVVEEEAEEEPVEVVEEEVEEVVTLPKPDLPEITINGIVKRSGGRSTAWVNGANTTTGDLGSQYIKVNPNRIGRDHVHVEMDIGDEALKDVSLKVGQSLDPDERKITDTYNNMLEEHDKK